MADISPDELEEFEFRRRFEEEQSQIPSKAVSNSTPARSSLGVSQAESWGRGAAQQATFGFQDEATAAVDAAVEKIREMAGSESSLAPGQGIADKYKAALAQNRQENAAAEKTNPMSYMGGKLIGGLPSAIAMGGTSLVGQTGAAAATAGLSSLGESQDKSALEASKKAVKDATIAGGLALVLGGGVRLLAKGLKSLSKSPKEAFGAAYKLEESLTNPKVAQQVGQEIDDVGVKFEQLSMEARNEIGQGLDNLAKRTVTRVDPSAVIKEISNKLNAYNPGSNALAQGAKKDLNEALTQLSKDLLNQADESGKVSFETLHNIKKTLSQTVHEQGLYKDSAYVDKLAKQLYSGISNTLKTTDKTGQYKSMSKVYSALSSSDPEAFTANALKYLQDPWDVTARGRLGRLLGDLQDMAPEMQQLYTPKLASFIDREFQDAALKAELLKNVGGKAGALVLKGIKLPNLSSIASDMGAWAGSSGLKPIVETTKSVATGLGSLNPITGPIAAPIAAGFSTVGLSNFRVK